MNFLLNIINYFNVSSVIFTDESFMMHEANDLLTIFTHERIKSS